MVNSVRYIRLFFDLLLMHHPQNSSDVIRNGTISLVSSLFNHRKKIQGDWDLNHHFF